MALWARRSLATVVLAESRCRDEGAKGRRRLAASALSLVAGLSLLAPQQALAQPAELRYDLEVDLPLTLTIGAWYAALELSKDELAAMPCRLCDRTLNPLDASVRDALLSRDTERAARVSDVIAFGASPLAAYGTIALASADEGAFQHFPVDALLITEAVATSVLVNDVFKFAVGRERPFVHALSPEQKSLRAASIDDNTSFYSGHTSLTFSLAVASGTVATLRGYRLAPLVFATGLSTATATGYLRIAADRHYFTDVLVGAIMGSAFGFALPFAFHGRKSEPAGPAGGLPELPQGTYASFAWQR